MTAVSAEDVFDHLTRHAIRTLLTPISLVSFVTGEEQLFKAQWV